MKSKALLFLILMFLLIGCAGPRISTKQRQNMKEIKINRLAISPRSGLLGEAIALELFNYGVNVVDANEALAIVGRAGLTEFELTTSKGYSVLRKKGVDALLVAKTIMAYDGTPENASVRIISTANGELIAGITWENGWGGQRGSIADRSMRVNLSSAAQQVARELMKRIKLK